MVQVPSNSIASRSVFVNLTAEFKSTIYILIYIEWLLYFTKLIQPACRLINSGLFRDKGFFGKIISGMKRFLLQI